MEDLNSTINKLELMEYVKYFTSKLEHTHSFLVHRKLYSLKWLIVCYINFPSSKVLRSISVCHIGEDTSACMWSCWDCEETGTLIPWWECTLITSVDGSVATFVKIIHVQTFDSAVPCPDCILQICAFKNDIYSRWFIAAG